ncbi:carbohydrate ABC transporter permease [Paenibacillus arenosi]|uniref:Carbohydrate ABC transporter permease n=1 Tax=Paenibacillus arenosi TaxID=2774142 RepID=A0ABR9AVM6_9BACL|nr:carbohydrate ABC transporter permease [Paenibacillus arenosi]MBD8498057.1 carbohydrate ABC transporter permease [Paenibacillus arenosi]
MKQSRSINFVSHIILVFYALLVIYPLFFVISSSFKNNSEIFDDPWGMPMSFSFDNYIEAMSNSHIDSYFINSLYISSISTFATILLSTTIAYAVTRMKFHTLSKGVYSLLLLSLLIPPASLLIPLYKMINDFGIYDTPLALIIPYSAFGIPLTVFVIAAFLKSIPLELEEAGVMDGLNTYGLLFRIVIPLTLPTLVTVFILNFIGNWNEFVMANLFISNEASRTLPVAVKSFVDQYNMNYGALTAAITISIIPVILIYSFLQKKIIEGVTAGSVKG